MALYIGLMSGTSLDGVDAVLADIHAHGAARALSHRHRAFDTSLRDALFALNRSGSDELHRAALAGNALARSYAALTAELLHSSGCEQARVVAVGAHGQTVRHRPGEFDGTGYTLQLLNGALLAETCGIDVVCDLRSRDVAAGGQGAPLVPAFHAAAFARPGTDSAVLNLGGIGNLTLLSAAGQVRGFDCGPGNMLLDDWCAAHLRRPFDDEGRWAASGTIDTALLQQLLAEPFFQRSPPKSTGRDLFDRAWLQRALQALPRAPAPADVMATLAELTVAAAAQALRAHAPATSELLVCGGGAFNAHLMRRLARHLAGIMVHSTAERGVPPDQVEALAFAWLAHAFVARKPGSLPAVTGAAGPRLLGALYPAGRK